MKTRPTRHIFFWVGFRCHWRVISRYDGSLIEQGSELKMQKAREAASAATARVRERILKPVQNQP